MTRDMWGEAYSAVNLEDQSGAIEHSAERTPGLGTVMPASSRLRAVRAADVIASPLPNSIVEGVAWAGCVTVLVSESGTGKTFLLLNLGTAVSAGVAWHGRQVTHGSVVYAGYEGDNIPLRLRAIDDTQNGGLEHLYRIEARDPISPRATAREGEQPSAGEMTVTAALQELSEDLRQMGRPPIVLVIIDTVRASLAGSEDSSDTVSAYMRAVRRMMCRLPEAAVILSHHAGWQDGKTPRARERGSSAWRGNADATLFLSGLRYDPQRGEKRLRLETRKTRDNEPPPPLDLILRRVLLAGEDTHGRPLSSCIVAHDRGGANAFDAEMASIKDQEAAAHHDDIDILIARLTVSRPDQAKSQGDIALALGKRKKDVTDSLKRLRERNHVTGGAGKVYTLTQTGRIWLAEQK